MFGAHIFGDSYFRGGDLNVSPDYDFVGPLFPVVARAITALHLSLWSQTLFPGQNILGGSLSTGQFSLRVLAMHGNEEPGHLSMRNWGKSENFPDINGQVAEWMYSFASFSSRKRMWSVSVLTFSEIYFERRLKGLKMMPGRNFMKRFFLRGRVRVKER